MVRRAIHQSGAVTDAVTDAVPDTVRVTYRMKGTEDDGPWYARKRPRPAARFEFVTENHLAMLRRRGEAPRAVPVGGPSARPIRRRLRGVVSLRLGVLRLGVLRRGVLRRGVLRRGAGELPLAQGSADRTPAASPSRSYLARTRIPRGRLTVPGRRMPRVRPCLLVRSRVGAAALCLAALARAGSVALDAGDDLAPQGYGIAGVPSGTYRVLVRGVGSQPVELRTRLASGDTTWLQLAVARASAPQRATVP
ncbi:MAG: hypothetical protein ACXW0Z_14015, partial [Gemmatirosa sp.]